jgi:hypothetical protein
MKMILPTMILPIIRLGRFLSFCLIAVSALFVLASIIVLQTLCTSELPKHV